MAGYELESVVHPHTLLERAHLFTTDDGGATEHEHLAVLGALVRALKPERILETGTYRGAGTLALAAAAWANGFGEIYTLDINQDALDFAEKRVKAALPEVTVHYVKAESMEWIPEQDLPFGFAFLDSMLAFRADELGLLLDRQLLGAGAVACIHDTSRARVTNDDVPDPEVADFYRDLAAVRKRHPTLRSIELPFSRGMTMFQPGVIR